MSDDHRLKGTLGLTYSWKVSTETWTEPHARVLTIMSNLRPSNSSLRVFHAEVSMVLPPGAGVEERLDNHPA